MLARSAFERLFQAFPSGAAKRIDVYCDFFKSYPVDVIDETVEHCIATWQKQSAPPIPVFEDRARQVQAERGGAVAHERTMSAGECRALIVKRLEMTQGTSSYIAIIEENIREHWRRFNVQLDWPAIEGTARSEEKPHRFDEEEEATGRMILGLARLNIFWCHKRLMYVRREEVQCRNWSFRQCQRAVQPSPEETREAWQVFGKGKTIDPPKTRPVRTDGPVPVADAMGGMF